MMEQYNYQGATGLRQRIAELTANPNTRAIVVGVAAVALTPVVLPLVKPVLKSTLKSGVTLLEKTKVALAETGEVMADIVAEAKAEAQAESLQQKVAQTPALSAAKSSTSED
ncbi:DUF5132 domain-containing protein [Lyngbya sp. CCY1209]|uniref:DUF5132 domain-containing protein n=1 Tax=Lyngbya sp. CCY1209 TaxID=2886103 RepID=UPI002D202E35|nr:DUF5132 domain-containing protein [Lyngbya sp. CCY1209]MEB3884294.1 DUF5132 domain-containing protein [Lyngbya sp. CCY1209]